MGDPPVKSDTSRLGGTHCKLSDEDEQVPSSRLTRNEELAGDGFRERIESVGSKRAGHPEPMPNTVWPPVLAVSAEVLSGEGGL